MIRKAKEEDLKRIMDLLYQVHDVHAKGRPDIFKVGEKKFNDEELLEIINNNDRPIYVYDDGIVKGYIFVEWIIEEGNRSKQKRKELYIEDFCVDSKYQRQGIGKALFEYAEILAKEENCDCITLNVWDFNEDALNFYKKMNMKPLKTIMEKIV